MAQSLKELMDDTMEDPRNQEACDMGVFDETPLDDEDLLEDELLEEELTEEGVREQEDAQEYEQDDSLNELAAIDYMNQTHIEEDPVFEGPTSDICTHPSRPAPGRRGSGVVTGPGPRRLLSGRRKTSVGDASVEQKEMSDLKLAWILKKRELEVKEMKNAIKDVENLTMNYRGERLSYWHRVAKLEKMEQLYDNCYTEYTKLEAEKDMLMEQSERYVQTINHLDSVTTNYAQQYQTLQETAHQEMNRLNNAMQYLKEANKHKLNRMTTGLNKIKEYMQLGKDELGKIQSAKIMEKDSNGEVIALAKLQGEVTRRIHKLEELKDQAHSLENSIAATSEDMKKSKHREIQLKERLARTLTDKEVALAKLDCLATEKEIKEDIVNLASICDMAAFFFAQCDEVITRHDQVLRDQYRENENTMTGVRRSSRRSSSGSVEDLVLETSGMSLLA
ncbi:coiled-coil domain-containing protein 158-like isoform X2 [Ambystoma mexicanum]|uniref:coiled-coil domain-containing protein 158-like isoform X2 n=1 Tax=Ambystoma mexicanum TaxID=8296 RepID=UPI0037E8F14F